MAKIIKSIEIYGDIYHEEDVIPYIHWKLGTGTHELYDAKLSIIGNNLISVVAGEKEDKQNYFNILVDSICEK